MFIVTEAKAKDEEILIKKLFLSEMKTESNVYVLWLKNKIGFLAWEPCRASELSLSLCTLSPHFRHSSLKLKTMMAMSSEKRIVVRSVTVIYTKRLPELDVIQTSCLKSLREFEL